MTLHRPTETYIRLNSLTYFLNISPIARATASADSQESR